MLYLKNMGLIFIAITIQIRYYKLTIILHNEPLKAVHYHDLTSVFLTHAQIISTHCDNTCCLF